VLNHYRCVFIPIVKKRVYKVASQLN